MSKEIRYELEVGGAKGYLAPLTFPVAEAALGNKILPFPKLLTAGAILINSLWVRGSATLKEKGENFDEACLQAAGLLTSLETNFIFENNEIAIPLKDKVYKCKISEKIDREVLEEALGYLAPNGMLPKPLMAGKKILFENWESGDEEIKTNEELLVFACTACYNLVRFKGGSVKKV